MEEESTSFLTNFRFVSAAWEINYNIPRTRASSSPQPEQLVSQVCVHLLRDGEDKTVPRCILWKLSFAFLPHVFLKRILLEGWVARNSPVKHLVKNTDIRYGGRGRTFLNATTVSPKTLFGAAPFERSLDKSEARSPWQLLGQTGTSDFSGSCRAWWATGFLEVQTSFFILASIDHSQITKLLQTRSPFLLATSGQNF